MRLSSGPKPLKQDLIMKIKEQYVIQTQLFNCSLTAFHLIKWPSWTFYVVLPFIAEVDTINRMYKTKWTVFQLDGRTSKDPNSVNPRFAIGAIGM